MNCIQLRAYTSKMDTEYKKVFKSMRIYLGTKHINPYAQNEILKELAGMCIENQERGTISKELFAQDYQTFCDEVSEQALRQSMKERILYWSAILLGNFILLLLVGFVLQLFTPFPMQISSEYIRINASYFYNLITISMICSVLSTFQSRLIFHNQRNVFLLFFGLYWICMQGIPYVTASLETEFITISWLVVAWLVGGVCASLFLNHYLAKRAYQRQS